MFESIREPGTPERLRNAALIPLAAFLAAQGYLAIYPLLTRVPATLFWTVVAILLIGTTVGAAQITRLVSRHFRSLDLPAAGWLLMAILMTALTARQLVAMAIPWL